jgi:hypothetical protein
MGGLQLTFRDMPEAGSSTRLLGERGADACDAAGEPMQVNRLQVKRLHRFITWSRLSISLLGNSHFDQGKGARLLIRSGLLVAQQAAGAHLGTF